MKKRKNNPATPKDCKSSKGISVPFSGVVGCVGSLPRLFPLFNFLYLLVSSVSGFHLDTGRAVVETLGSLFSYTVGRERCCKQMLLACAYSVSSTLSLPLLAVDTAQALRSSTGEPSEAGPRLHAPLGLSHSGSALRKPSEVQIWLSLCFVPSPGPKSSGVWRGQSLRLWPFPLAQFSGCTTGVPSQADDDCPEPPEVLVNREACLHFGR